MSIFMKKTPDELRAIDGRDSQEMYLLKCKLFIWMLPFQVSQDCYLCELEGICRRPVWKGSDCYDGCMLKKMKLPKRSPEELAQIREDHLKFERDLKEREELREKELEEKRKEQLKKLKDKICHLNR